MQWGYGLSKVTATTLCRRIEAETERYQLRIGRNFADISTVCFSHHQSSMSTKPSMMSCEKPLGCNGM